ncbi:hypothetical protein SAMN05444671_3130 [Flavobacterium sp. CF108]|uniref:hypothetical protein n=1 Tax=unclassified Flavobacterium TaxID=196869 RepID=UPI0008CC3C29|nr:MULTISPECIES: hypothetical protein [unclassified Flavobacterium]SEP29494.1 hypothetical protein SAMN04487978_0426 [Flavobacterium sp. fv08]SHH54937.1 hypothetical protein SAMN05444671_3130 [Flavobacterium sp. CF108]
MTTQNKPRKTKYKSKGIDLMPYLYGIGVLAFLFLLYILYRMYITERRLIPLSAFALIAGAIYEAKYIVKDWQKLIMTALGSFALSFIAFIPGKREGNYNFEMHIQIWPYFFLVILIIAVIGFNKDKIIPKLTEGITLLQSIAIIYWVIDFGFLKTKNVFLLFLMFIGLIFSGFSIFHAFTKTELTRTNRLILSIWSTIVIFLLAAENIFKTISYNVTNTYDLASGLYSNLPFFLLGVSSFYIVQNFVMLISFLPRKGAFFNKVYYKELKELKNDHIERYSFEQVHISNSMFCIIFTSIIFYLNYYYKVVPKHIAIWFVFFIFQLISNFFDYQKIETNE